MIRIGEETCQITDKDVLSIEQILIKESHFSSRDLGKNAVVILLNSKIMVFIRTIKTKGLLPARELQSAGSLYDFRDNNSRRMEETSEKNDHVDEIPRIKH